MAGILLLGQGPQFSQRSVINLGFTFDNSYPLINFYLMGAGSTGPFSSAFSTGTPWPALIDANGWPNQPITETFGGSATIPGSDEYTGAWVITWDGNGFVNLAAGTWTETNLVTPGTATISIANPAVVTFANSFSAGQQVVFTTTGALPTGLFINTVYYVLATGLSGSSFRISATKGGAAIVTTGSQSGTQTVNGTYSKSSNGRWFNTFDAVSPYVTATLSSATGPQALNIQFFFTDMNATGTYLKNFRLYQSGDEADLLAGKLFRAAFKQSLVNLNPSAIRFLDWTGGSSASDCRFDTRSLPNVAGYAPNTNWIASPSYPAATGTNIFSVGVAVPTAANPKTTPASLTHGEIATLRFTSGSVRGGQFTISAISNASSNPQVTTSAAHGLSTNDIVSLYHVVGGTFTNLNYFPCKVTVADATHFTIQSQAGVAINTSGYGTFTSGVGTQYWSINVGARGVKPIAFPDASDPGSVFGEQMFAGGYQTLVYDKNIAILGDGAGNLSNGAWRLMTGTGAWADGPPLEIMVALINEVNALSVSQGISAPINMWLNIPHAAMTTMDTDYTTGSDFALNAVDVVINGANGYSGLTANAKLFIEYSNETWNFGGGFYAYYYLVRMGYLRWPASGQSNAVDMYTLRSTIAMRTVKATFGTSRVKYVLAGKGFDGYGIGNQNQLRVEGNTYYLNDPIVTGGSFGRPIDNHDAFCYATYFDSGPFYYGGTGTGSFTDDSAMFAGTTPYSSPNQAQAITNFVNQVVSNTFSDPDAQTVNQYLDGSLSGLTAIYATAMQALGKVTIGYEGGPDWRTAISTGDSRTWTWGGHMITSADRAFLLAALNSTQWRDAQVGFFNRVSQVPGAKMPSVFTYIGNASDQRWSYCTPDSFGGTATEGQGLLNSPVWVGMGARNQALST